MFWRNGKLWVLRKSKRCGNLFGSYKWDLRNWTSLSKVGSLSLLLVKEDLKHLMIFGQPCNEHGIEPKNTVVKEEKHVLFNPSSENWTKLGTHISYEIIKYDNYNNSHKILFNSPLTFNNQVTT